MTGTNTKKVYILMAGSLKNLDYKKRLKRVELEDDDTMTNKYGAFNFVSKSVARLIKSGADVQEIETEREASDNWNRETYGEAV